MDCTVAYAAELPLAESAMSTRSVAEGVTFCGMSVGNLLFAMLGLGPYGILRCLLVVRSYYRYEYAVVVGYRVSRTVTKEVFVTVKTGPYPVRSVYACSYGVIR